MTAERRVVHVVRSDGFAGVERYICDVARGLHERDWRVAVVGGDATRMLLPATVEHLPARTTADVARQLAALAPIPLVHAHMTAAEAAAVATKPVTRARVVATRHFAAPRGTTMLSKGAARVWERGIAREIAISHFVAAKTRRPATVIHNGVPAPDDYARRTSPRRILVMQRLETEKDTGTALRAFARSGLADDGWRLLVAGRGAEAGRLQDEAIRLGIAGATDWLGFVDNPEATRRHADVLLAPAPAEPFGLSVVEAMATGLAVVAADGGAHRETLGEVGLLFPPGDAEAAAAALRRLADSPAWMRDLGQAGRHRHKQFFSLERHLAALERLYHEVSP